jgi:hypothetical protein
VSPHQVLRRNHDKRELPMLHWPWRPGITQSASWSFRVLRRQHHRLNGCRRRSIQIARRDVDRCRGDTTSPSTLIAPIGHALEQPKDALPHRAKITECPAAADRPRKLYSRLYRCEPRRPPHRAIEGSHRVRFTTYVQTSLRISLPRTHARALSPPRRRAKPFPRPSDEAYPHRPSARAAQRACRSTHDSVLQ